jgi:hypothetical protein
MHSPGIEYATEQLPDADERGEDGDPIWWADALERVIAGQEKKRRG